MNPFDRPERETSRCCLDESDTEKKDTRKKDRRPGPPCDRLAPDDGIDPRILFRREDRRKITLRKDRQLCKEAFRVLALWVGERSHQPWARGLSLEEVRPAPDASRLEVRVRWAEDLDPAEVQERFAGLRQLTGSLRSELARALARKKVPELFFVLGGGEPPTEAEPGWESESEEQSDDAREGGAEEDDEVR